MCWKELVSSMIWGCALFKDLSRARLAVDVMLNSSQCIARRNKTALQWVWWLCAKPLSGHQAQGPILHCMSMPRSYPSQCEQCAYIARQSIWQRNKDIFLQRNLSHVLYEYCWGGGGAVCFCLFFLGGEGGVGWFFFNKPAKLQDIEKRGIGWNPGSTKVIGKIPIDFPRVSLHLQYGPLCILSWWHPNNMCFAYKPNIFIFVLSY